ncbi:MAG: hypothetical protein Kow009_11290 [Spirochaetales bacterium]
MEIYRLETTDGILHLYTVVSRGKNEIEFDTLHSDGMFTVRGRQFLDVCLFELLMKLGFFREVDAVPESLRPVAYR